MDRSVYERDAEHMVKSRGHDEVAQFILKLFQAYDVDGNGRLHRQELQPVLSSIAGR